MQFCRQNFQGAPQTCQCIWSTAIPYRCLGHLFGTNGRPTRLSAGVDIPVFNILYTRVCVSVYFWFFVCLFWRYEALLKIMKAQTCIPIRLSLIQWPEKKTKKKAQSNQNIAALSVSKATSVWTSYWWQPKGAGVAIRALYSPGFHWELWQFVSILTVTSCVVYPVIKFGFCSV